MSSHVRSIRPGHASHVDLDCCKEPSFASHLDWLNSICQRLCFAAIVALQFIPANLNAQDRAANFAWRAGAAKIDITPDYPIRLSGFGSRRAESDGVTHRIFARGLALIDSEGRRAVLITVDNCGVSWNIASEVAAALANDNVTPDRLTIAATHTHTAPMLAGVLPAMFGEAVPEPHLRRIDQYTREFTAALIHVSRQALANARPATLSWEIGNVEFARNRRTAGGPVDHDLPALFVRDEQGTVMAVHTTYACHCVTLSHNMISGDWAGYAAEFIEKEFPGAVGLVSIGCGADANPDSGVTGDRIDAAQTQGAAIAAEVRRLATSELKPLPATLLTTFTTIDLAVDQPRSREEWESRAAQAGAVGYHARLNLERLNAGQELRRAIHYPVQTWKFGDQMAMVFLPGEVVVDYALRLKLEFGKTRLWICGYSNDLPCYIPSERILREGGYEGEGAMVYYDLPQRLAPGVEESIIDEVHRQLAPEFEPIRDEQLRQAWADPNQAPSPAAILKSFEIADGFQIELIAAEPLVADPVAIAFGIDGALWVCQMGDYPLGVDGQFGAGGEVRVLRDTTGDGHFDRAVTFLDKLPFPTGVLPWRDGLLICAAPDILFARDTDGDDRADEVRTLFSGFATHNYHARVNSLRYGLDGWVYGSGGLFGGEITSFSQPTPVNVTHRDFRIQPDAGLIEAVIGQTQQGRSRNDWGDWFGCDNSMLARHYPLVEHYVRRNPRIAPPLGAVPVSGEADPGQVFAISNATLLPLSGPSNRVTAATGLGVLRDDAWGAEWNGDLFVCESVGNLIHHLRVEPRGATFVGKRLSGQTTSEFLASYSPWFRPVEAISGPDGGLWIVDMCRWVIEHPTWIPADVLSQLDLRAGSDQGRIFRITRTNQKPREPILFDRMTHHQLVAALESPNGWQRDLAMEMLVWDGASDVADELRALIHSSPNPATRLQALATLAQLPSSGQSLLSAQEIAAALADPHPGIRRHAIRWAEGFPELHTTLFAMATSVESTDIPLCQQLAWSLGEVNTAAAEVALAELIIRWSHDRYVFAAALSSLHEQNAAGVVQHVLNAAPIKTLSEPQIAELLALSIALTPDRSRPLCAAFVADAPLGDQRQTTRRLNLLLDAMVQAGISAETQSAHLSDPLIAAVFAGARQIVADPSAATDERAQAAGLLARSRQFAEQDAAALLPLLQPQVPVELQRAAIEGLGRLNDETAFAAAIAPWETLTPTIRELLMQEMLARSAGAEAILSALETGAFPLTALNATRRQQLLVHPVDTIRIRTETALRHTASGTRAEVVEAYADVLTTAGEVGRGREVFRKACASCHLLEGTGYAIGPDLAALANRAPESLLVSILDPSRDVDARYLQYVARTDDGRTLTGMLTDETGAGFTLVGQNDERHVVLRSQLDELRSTKKSLMPDAIERDLTRQELADVIVYLVEVRGERKQTPGNQPRVIVADAAGHYELPASAAAIYGGDIEYEAGPRAIGYWHGEQDFAEWVIEVEREGTFDVLLDWSCAPYSAGNRLALDCGRQRLQWTVQSTGAWDRMETISLGTLTLSPGRTRLVVRPDSPLTKPALLDLQTVRLVRQ